MSPDWKSSEEKWQRRWAEARLFESDPDPKRKKCFVTFPYPYMGGPMHVGHLFTISRLDAYARYMRMKGYNVLFPWAWHWTGETVAGAAERIRKGDKSFIEALTDLVKGALYPAVNDSQVKAQPIALPTLDEQRRIARVLCEQMAAVEKARAASEEELQTINALPAALLRRAFNGEI